MSGFIIHIEKRYGLFILLILILPAFFSTYQLNAQPVASRIVISPLNRVTVYFSQLPIKYSSELSPDKMRIVLKIPSARISESAREAHSTGIIQDVYLQTTKNGSSLIINLNDKRGYTAVPLPYSNAIMIEVFQWNSLSVGDDNYRTGLLGLENGNPAAAENYLRKAQLSGNADAAAYLGIIYLQRGLMYKAAENIKTGIKNSTTIPDAFAAMSQILKINNMPALSKTYSALFTRKSGIATWSDIEIATTEDSSLSENKMALVELLNDPALSDTSSFSGIANKKSPDSVNNNKSFENLFSKDSVKNKEKEASQKKDSFTLPGWFSMVGIYAAVVLFFALIIIVSAYVRWRKKQLMAAKSSKKAPYVRKTPPETRVRSNANPANASKAYLKAGSLIDKTIEGNENEKVIGKKSETASTETGNDNKGPAAENIDGKEKFFEILNKIEENMPAEIIPPQSEENINQKQDSGTKTSMSAKLELALHLQQEQQKLKRESIESIGAREIPADQQKLSEVARKLGIEQGSLETKKNLSRLEDDNTNIIKLAEKFSVKKINGK